MKRAFVVFTLIFALCAPMAVLAQEQPAPPAPAPAPAPPTMPPPVAAPRTQVVTCIVQALRIISSLSGSTLQMNLKLSQEEYAKVRNLLAKAEEETSILLEAQRKAAADFAIALSAETTTQPELQALAEKTMKAETEVLNAKIRTYFALKAMLTPEQNAVLAALLKRNIQQWLPREMRTTVSPLAAPMAPATTAPDAPAGNVP